MGITEGCSDPGMWKDESEGRCPRMSDLKRSVLTPVSEQGMHLQACRMIAARDGLCPYKDLNRRLLSGAHKDTLSKLEFDL